MYRKNTLVLFYCLNSIIFIIFSATMIIFLTLIIFSATYIHAENTGLNCQTFVLLSDSSKLSGVYSILDNLTVFDEAEDDHKNGLDGCPLKTHQKCRSTAKTVSKNIDMSKTKFSPK